MLLICFHEQKVYFLLNYSSIRTTKLHNISFIYFWLKIFTINCVLLHWRPLSARLLYNAFDELSFKMYVWDCNKNCLRIFDLGIQLCSMHVNDRNKVVGIFDTSCKVWQYRLWNFKLRNTKSNRLMPKSELFQIILRYILK